MGRRLVALDDDAEAVDGGEILAAVLVEAADLHVLAGQMVEREVDLELGVARVLAVGEAAHQLLERVQRLGGSEEHTSELQSLMRISYAVFCLKQKTYSTALRL